MTSLAFGRTFKSKYAKSSLAKFQTSIQKRMSQGFDSIPTFERKGLRVYLKMLFPLEDKSFRNLSNCASRLYQRSDTGFDSHFKTSSKIPLSSLGKLFSNTL